MYDPVASLPQDLNTDILSGLPAKSIAQLRCVSSPWRELLSDPQFIRAHHTRHIHDAEKLILIDSYDYSPHIVDINVDTESTGSSSRNHGVSRKFFCQTPQYNKWAKVEGSCHGLVLVVVKGENTRLLINPTTSETEEVPNFCLASDRRISSSACGLGYDCSNNDFKIVALSRYSIRKRHKPSVDIYSVKQKSWRSLENSPFDVPSLASGIFLNGAIYWLARSRSRSVIAAFNLAREKFDDVPLPLPKDLKQDDLFKYFELKVIGGCLAVYTSLGHLWVMKEYGKQDSWEWIRIPSRPQCSFKPICLLSNGKMVFEKNDSNEGMDLVLYNNTKGKKRTCRKMVVAGIPVRFGHGTFTESLLSPNFKSDYPLQ